VHSDVELGRDTQVHGHKVYIRLCKRGYKVNLDSSILYTPNLRVSGDKSTTTKLKNHKIYIKQKISTNPHN